MSRTLFDDILVPFIQKYGPILTVRVVTRPTPIAGRSRPPPRGWVLARAKMRLTKTGQLHHHCDPTRLDAETCKTRAEATALAQTVSEEEGRVITQTWVTPEVARELANFATLGRLAGRMEGYR